MTVAAHTRDVTADQEAARALAMDLLTRATDLNRAGLDLSRAAITRQHGYGDRRSQRANEAVHWLVDQGYLVDLMHEPAGSPTYRITPAGWRASGQTPPPWVVE